MARKLSDTDFQQPFDLEDIVTFPNPDGGDELRGRVVRVYNSGDLYHVMVEGERYEVDGSEMRRAPSPL